MTDEAPAKDEEKGEEIKRTISGRFVRYVGNHLPNDFSEEPNEVRGDTPSFKPKVKENYHKLDLLGTAVTIFQYVIILATILFLVLSKIYKGAEISFTEQNPTYMQFKTLKDNTDINNLNCVISNDKLSYEEFTDFLFEKADACKWVMGDMSKLGKEDIYTPRKKLTEVKSPNENMTDHVIKRKALGQVSACKLLQKESTCSQISRDCRRGHKLTEDMLQSVRTSLFPFKSLVTDEGELSAIVNATVAQSLQALLSGLKGPIEAIESWSSKNMPMIYGYLGSLHNYIQGELMKGNASSSNELRKTVSVACTVYNLNIAERDRDKCNMKKIGDGVCDQGCNNPYCLNDGGDCLTPSNQHYGGSHAFQTRDKNVLDFQYRAFFPLQQGEKLRQNPWYNFSDTTIYNDTLWDKVWEDGEYDFSIEDLKAQAEHTFLTNKGNIPIWRSLGNYFEGFDPNATCGDPNTWFESYEQELPKSRVNTLKASQDYVFSSLESEVFSVLGFPSGKEKPGGEPPVQNTDTFSCDSFSKSLNLPGVSGHTAAQIKDWIDYLYTIFDWCKNKCPANKHGEWDQDDCPRLPVNQTFEEFQESETDGWSDYDYSDYDYNDYWSDYDYSDYDYSDYWSDYDYSDYDYSDYLSDYDYSDYDYSDYLSDYDYYEYPDYGGSDYDYSDYDYSDYGSAPLGGASKEALTKRKYRRHRKNTGNWSAPPGGASSPPGRASKETLAKRKYRRHRKNAGNSTGDITGKVIPLYMISKGDSYSLVKVAARLEYAYLANAANENSGSIKQLILDAGLKRNESGFAVMPLVNYQDYYTKAKVSQCTYTKKVGASPGTVVAVVLGLIGGVTTSVTFFCIFMYSIFRMRILKNWRKEQTIT
jgi:hypothetical protein